MDIGSSMIGLGSSHVSKQGIEHRNLLTSEELDLFMTIFICLLGCV